MIISEILKQFDEQSIALQTLDETIKFGDLLAVSSDLNVENFIGLRVVISLSRVEAVIKAVTLLDGVAAAIIFISHTLSPEASLELAHAGRADVILADLPRHAGGANLIAAVDNIKSLQDYRTRAGLGERVTTQWIMATSGTTGAPKLVAHSLASLCRTTKLNPQMFPVSWALLYDHSRFAGIQVVLQSLLSGAKLTVPDYNMSLSEKICFFSRVDCTHASSTPTMWRNIIMLPEARAWNLRSISLGGEIADGHVLECLKKFYPNARITHIFASTEAGVGFSVTDGKQGFPASYLSSPPSGIQLKISESRLFIRNSEVQGAYVGSNACFKDHDNWVDTGDVVQEVGDRIHFVGRENGLINVGGNKVMPEVIEAALLVHPSVAGAHVFSKSNPFSGSVVAANVVLRSNDKDPLEVKKSIFNHLSQCLEAFQIPAIISIVDTIPLNSAGKVIRK